MTCVRLDTAADTTAVVRLSQHDGQQVEILLTVTTRRTTFRTASVDESATPWTSRIVKHRIELRWNNCTTRARKTTYGNEILRVVASGRPRRGVWQTAWKENHVETTADRITNDKGRAVTVNDSRLRRSRPQNTILVCAEGHDTRNEHKRSGRTGNQDGVVDGDGAPVRDIERLR